VKGLSLKLNIKDLTDLEGQAQPKIDNIKAIKMGLKYFLQEYVRTIRAGNPGIKEKLSMHRVNMLCKVGFFTKPAVAPSRKAINIDIEAVKMPRLIEFLNA